MCGSESTRICKRASSPHLQTHIRTPKPQRQSDCARDNRKTVLCGCSETGGPVASIFSATIHTASTTTHHQIIVVALSTTGAADPLGWTPLIRSKPDFVDLIAVSERSETHTRRDATYDQPPPFCGGGGIVALPRSCRLYLRKCSKWHDCARARLESAYYTKCVKLVCGFLLTTMNCNNLQTVCAKPSFIISSKIKSPTRTVCFSSVQIICCQWICGNLCTRWSRYKMNRRRKRLKIKITHRVGKSIFTICTLYVDYVCVFLDAYQRLIYEKSHAIQLRCGSMCKNMYLHTTSFILVLYRIRFVDTLSLHKAILFMIVRTHVSQKIHQLWRTTHHTGVHICTRRTPLPNKSHARAQYITYVYTFFV